MLSPIEFTFVLSCIFNQSYFKGNEGQDVNYTLLLVYVSEK